MVAGRAVDTQIIAGVMFAWVAAFAGLGLFFAIAYMLRRREPEHLVFALLSLTLSVHTYAVSAWYARPEVETFRWSSPIALGAAVAGAAFMLHFALLFGGNGGKTTLIRSIYLTAAAFEASIVWPGAIDYTTARASATGLAGGLALQITASTTPAGQALLGAIELALLSATALLARAVYRGRRDGVPALAGAIVLLATSLHDAWRSSRGGGDLWLAPHGFIAFAFGVTTSLLVRYSLLGKDLERDSLELERSYATLREAQAEVVRKKQLAVVGELAAVIAHEVRNPLAIITNAVASLRRRELAKTDREVLLEILDEESRRLNRLVGDLLRYARPVNIDAQAVTVAEVVERAVRGRDAEGGIELHLSDDAPGVRVSGDPGLLRQAFDNLLDNAVHAMPDGGTLRVRLSSERRHGRDGLGILVADTGMGMPPDVLRRAKDPFFTTRPSGTGLGLSIVERIIEAHGGELSLDSAPGAGTRVTVFLPSSRREQGRAAEPATTGLAAGAGGLESI